VHAVDVVTPNQARPSSARLAPRSIRERIRDGSDDTRIVPSGPRISARPAPDSATARSVSGASTCAANGSAKRSRTIGVDAMFSATAIIR
jgi:hypothetical protein